jgi:hypothetical protein
MTFAGYLVASRTDPIVAFGTIRLGSRLLAAVLVAAGMMLLAHTGRNARPSSEPAAITMVQDVGLTPVPKPVLQPVPPVQAAPVAPATAGPLMTGPPRSMDPRPPAQTTPKVRGTDRADPGTPSGPMNRSGSPTPLANPAATGRPDQSAASEVPAAGNPGRAADRTAVATPGLGQASRATLRGLECQRLDPADRPPDCPAQGDRLMADAEAANGPQYRPERARGRSRAEARALFQTGLRDPCQMEDGSQAQVCLPIGPAPSRVRSPEEICRAQGLSNCVALPKAGPE